MQEVAWVHRPVVVALEDGMLSISNRRSFTDLADLRATWELLVAGSVVDAGELEVADVPPSTTVRVGLPCAIPDASDAHLSIRWSQRRATPWSPSGHLVAWDQLPQPEKCGDSVAGRTFQRTLRNDDAGNPKCAPDRASSALSSAFFGEGGGPELSVFRAPVDNDGLKLLDDLGEAFGVGAKTLARWRRAGVDRLPADELVTHTHVVETLDDGSQVHTHEVIVPPELDDLPRVGVSFELAPGFDRVRWYGRGPLENYPDRNRGALLGIWEAAVDESPYLVPQEFGLRTDCRWFEFVSEDATLRLDVLDPAVMHVSATRFTAQDLYAAGHETDLRPRRTLVVHADVAHRGLGTASCGPDVLDRYRIVPGTYSFSYRLSVR
jgi:beta-galactosidase